MTEGEVEPVTRRPLSSVQSVFFFLCFEYQGLITLVPLEIFMFFHFSPLVNNYVILDEWIIYDQTLIGNGHPDQ